MLVDLDSGALLACIHHKKPVMNALSISGSTLLLGTHTNGELQPKTGGKLLAFDMRMKEGSRQIATPGDPPESGNHCSCMYFMPESFRVPTGTVALLACDRRRNKHRLQSIHVYSVGDWARLKTYPFSFPESSSASHFFGNVSRLFPGVMLLNECLVGTQNDISVYSSSTGACTWETVSVNVLPGTRARKGNDRGLLFFDFKDEGTGLDIDNGDDRHYGEGTMAFKATRVNWKLTLWTLGKGRKGQKRKLCE